ncbi:MAG: TVP38/TMEM64 family protein [Clostridia bacterium]|nr:TVP38/TMEM64 family protein [Clostridia bacterium]
MNKKALRIISIVIFIIALALLSVIMIPLIKSYSNAEEFQSFIEGFGMWGFLMMLIVQIFQIIVALIPGEVVEFVAGTMYGWFGGLVLCCIGIAIGHFIIFKAVRYFGRDFVEKAAGSKIMNKFQFLQNESKLKTVMFVLFFLPGTPKDLLVYIAALTKITFRDFLVITLFARLPSIISSTYAGDAFADKNFIKLAIVYGIITICSVGGVIIYKILEAKYAGKHKNSSK